MRNNTEIVSRDNEAWHSKVTLDREHNIYSMLVRNINIISMCSSNLAQIPTDNMQKWTIRFLNNILFVQRKCFVLKSKREKPWIKIFECK